MTETSRSREASGAPASSGSQVERDDNGPSQYSHRRPQRIPYTRILLLGQLRYGVQTLIHLTQHTLGLFEPTPLALVPLTLSAPAGEILKPTLAICKQLADDADARAEKLETKSSSLLSLIALVAPLTASALVFIRQHRLPTVTSWITLVLDVVAMLCFLLGLVAAMRVLAVRGQQSLYLDTVVDPATNTIRPYNADFLGRGLLYIASVRQAMSDQIADFVRAAQMFLVIGVTLAVGAALPVLFQIREYKQSIQGTVALDPASLAAIQHDIETIGTYSDARFERLKAEIEELQDPPWRAALRAQIEDLQKQSADLRLKLAAKRRPPSGTKNIDDNPQLHKH
jgi:hypothetical protein